MPPRTRPARRPRPARGRALAAAVAAASAALALAACAPDGPRPIAYGEDQCGYCRMTISDRRFGAELQTATGKQHTFDSIECLAAYANAADAGAVRAAWVTDVARPGTLLGVDSARFWRVAGPGSPMGKGLVATMGAAPAGATGPTPMRWAEVRALVAREGMARGAGAAAGAGESAHAH